MNAIARKIEGNYGITLICALTALVPYLVMSGALDFFLDQIIADAGISKQIFGIAASLATAGYAFGALLGGDLINRFPKGKLFLWFELVVAAGWAMTALAGGPVWFALGHVATGFGTGIMLVVALPPTVQNFPSSRVDFTAVFINIGLFGAVAAAPLVGGLIAASHGWRAVFTGLAVFSFAIALIGHWTVPAEDPPEPDMPVDRSALALALVATTLPFLGAAMLSGAGFASPLFLVPVAAGLVAGIILLLIEYHKREPLAPVRKAWSTFPVIGLIVATFAGGVFVSITKLATLWLREIGGMEPLTAGLTFWPQAVGVLLSAALLGFVFRTRHMPTLILGGLLTMLVGGALLIGAMPESNLRTLVAMGAIGLGAGSTVSPALFLAGFSLQSQSLGRIVALIELVRSVGDFLLGPILVEFSKTLNGGTASAGSIDIALAIACGIGLATAIAISALYLLGGKLFRKPQVTEWLDDDQTALDSPPLLAVLRR